MQKLTLALALLVGCNQMGGSSAKQELKTEDDKTLYALGLMLGRNITTFNLNPRELDIVKQGLTDQVRGNKPTVELEQYGPKIQGLARTRAGAKADAEKEKSKSFLEAAAKEPGAQKTDSGLIFIPIKEGTGEQPKASDIVKVHYEGKLTNGEIFDSSVKRGQPAEFPLGNVIPCWTEGVQKIKVGGKAKLVCPSSIAYGDRGSPPKIPGGATLVFEVELLEIKPAPPAPALPALPGMSLPNKPGTPTPNKPSTPTPTKK
jgi:FKBP-type peptidyl-prolyl cis-trans isomerase FkpA